MTIIITINRFGFDYLTGYYANHFQTDIFARERITTGTITVTVAHTFHFSYYILFYFLLFYFILLYIVLLTL